MLPHDPQLFGSLCLSTHWPLHSIVLPLHVEVHEPLLQTSFAAQSLPHAPQLS